MRKRSWGLTGLTCVLTISLLTALTGCGSSAPQPTVAPAPVTPAATESPLAKLPTTWASSEELYAALAKLSPEEQRQAVLEGAKKEGKVGFYVASNEETAIEWKKDFEKRYPGVKLEYLRAKESDLVAKIQAEAAAGKLLMDISYGISFPALRKQGLMAKHYAIGLQDFPAAYLGEDWVSMEGLTTLLVYNTDMVKQGEAPKTLMELLEPKWKGKVHIDASPVTFISGLLLKWGEPKTRDFLKRLVVDNQAVIRKGHTQAASLIAAGEFPVSSELYSYRVEELRAGEKAPIDWVVPEVLPIELNSMGITKKAPNPFAALLFMQYMSSKEAHMIFASFGRQTTRSDVSFKYPRLEPLSTHPSASIISPDNMEKVYGIAETLIADIITPRLSGQKQ